MYNNSQNSSSTSSNKPVKTLSHYVSKFFRHARKSGNSSTGVLIGSSDFLLQSTQSGISAEENGKFLADISQPQILCDVKDAINDSSALATSAINESKSVNRAVDDETEEIYEQIVIEDDTLLQSLSSENRYGGQQFAVEHLPKFCEKLHNLVEIVRNILADSNSLTDYPKQLQTDLVNEAKELDVLYAEIRCIQTTIDRVRRQRDIIRNGKAAALEQQAKLEDEVIKEIEKSIAITEKPLVKSWERIKRCRTPESFEKLLNEVHRNLEVLKNLEVLIQNRKNNANNFDKTPKNDSILVNSILSGNVFEMLNI